MLIDGTDPSAAAKPDVRLINLLIRARRFHAALIGSGGVPFTALAKQEGVSRSYFTRLVRLSYLAPDITQAILDGRQPRGLRTSPNKHHLPKIANLDARRSAVVAGFPSNHRAVQGPKVRMTLRWWRQSRANPSRKMITPAMGVEFA